MRTSSTSFLRRRAVLAAALAGAVGAIGSGAVQAQPGGEWPSKVVTIVVPFPPGGGPDLLGRVVAEKLAPRIGQTVIVDNKPGAGGLMGAGTVARASADGHTLLLVPNTLVISPHVLPKSASAGLDVQRDLRPILSPATTPMVLLAHPQLGVSDVRQLVALAKREPGLAYGSAGNGSPMHFAGEMFKQAAGVDLLHVPYRGVAPSVTAALGGEVKLLFTGLGGAMAHIQSGKLVPLAVTEKARSPLARQIPTAGEQGVQGVEVNAWYGLFAPAATPTAVVERIQREVNAVLAMPDVRERMAAAGVEVTGGDAQRLADFVKQDDERYGRLARELSIRAD